MNILLRISSAWKKAVYDDAKKSLLSRIESNAIKGILIILIVLGHNKYVMQGGMSNVYLYSFHVYAFFYLPFLYDFKNMEWCKFFQKNLIRLYVPYSIFFFILLSIALGQNRLLSPFSIFATYICGSQNMLYTTFGFGSFLWFIPTMLSVLIIRQIYYKQGYCGRNIILLLSAICLAGYTYLLPLYVITWWYTPLCLTVALAMILPAVCLRWIFQNIPQQIITISFFFLTIAVMIVYPIKGIYLNTYLTINRLICPILIFSLLLTLKKFLSENIYIINLGKQSLIIYLIHQFIYNGFYIVSDKYNPGIYVGLLIFAFTIIVAYLISRLKLIKYVFPK